MSDPWLIQKTDNINFDSEQNSNLELNCSAVALENETNSLEFEDNFMPSVSVSINSNSALQAKQISDLTPLPDSEKYLQSLEQKLKNIQRSPKILDALSEKRADCLRNFVEDNSARSNDVCLELDQPISDSAVQELYRQIQPIQPLSVGEVVHIVNYDQLQQEDQEGNTDLTSSPKKAEDTKEC